MRRGQGGVRHDGVAGRVILVSEQAVEELRAAVEIQSATDQSSVVIGLDGVGESSAEAHGPFVEHELPAERTGTNGRKTGDS